MKTIKITSKRQATFPAQLLKDLGVDSGDEIELMQKKIKGKNAWLLLPRQPSRAEWFGALRPYMEKVNKALSRDKWRNVITREIHKGKY